MGSLSRGQHWAYDSVTNLKINRNLNSNQAKVNSWIKLRLTRRIKLTQRYTVPIHMHTVVYSSSLLFLPYPYIYIGTHQQNRAAAAAAEKRAKTTIVRQKGS